MLGSRVPIVDVEGFVNGESIGGVRKLDWPPVPLHQPRDPFFAESEIHVHPYPPRAGEPTRIFAELRNLSGVTRTVAVQFSWAHFGIGLPFQPINGPIVKKIPPHGRIEVGINWVPPFDGPFCIQARMQIIDPNVDYYAQFSQQNLDVGEPLVPGEPHSIVFPVGNFPHEFTNPDPRMRTISLTTDVLLPDWDVTVDPTVLLDVDVETFRLVTLTVKPPDRPFPEDGVPIVDVRAHFQDGDEPPWPAPPTPVTLWVTPTEEVVHMEDGAPVIDLEAYVGDELIGGIRKVFRPPVPIHHPGDPIYAEREITIHPYPPRAHEPTEVCVELRNPTPVNQTVIVHFAWAHFGIGLPFHPINGPVTVALPTHSIVRECITWIPRDGGRTCIKVEIERPGHEPLWSQRNIDVGEPLEPGILHALPFPVRNPLSYPVTVTLGLIPHVPDWEVGLAPTDTLINMLPGQEREVMLIVRPPPHEPLPPDGTVIVDVEAHADGVLIGGFRKVHRPPVPVHRPRDPVYAESEIGVDPYPAIPGHPTKLSVEVYNPTGVDRVVKATFSVAPFGIGLPFTTTHISPNPIHIFVPAHGAARGHTIWVPPCGAASSAFR
jgi:hypothetical protein